MKNIRILCLKNCHFLVVKFSVYLNRRVFVMLLLSGIFKVLQMDASLHTSQMHGASGVITEQ